MTDNMVMRAAQIVVIDPYAQDEGGAFIVLYHNDCERLNNLGTMDILRQEASRVVHEHYADEDTPIQAIAFYEDMIKMAQKEIAALKSLNLRP